MLSDIQIAQQTELKPIADIAASIGIKENELEPYGRYKAKLNEQLFDRLKDKKDGKRGKDDHNGRARTGYG